MWHKLGWLGTILAALVLNACGGGGSTGDTRTGATARPLAAQVPMLDTAALFDWAPTGYPQYFSGPHQDGSAFVEGYGTFTYREFQGTGNIVAVLASYVYVYGPLTGYQIRPVGSLVDFTCSVYVCPDGTQVNWNSYYTAQRIWEVGTVLAGPGGGMGQLVTIVEDSLPVEIILASQYPASLHVTTADGLNACINGGSFDYYPELTVFGQFGHRLATLPAGTYGFCLMNASNETNAVRVEFQGQSRIDGFHYSQPRFDTVRRNVPAGGRLTQAAVVGSTYRVLVDGASTGGRFYIIPASEQSNFLGGGTFEFLQMGCNVGGQAAPGLCELAGVGDYMIAYVNDTPYPQSIVIIGRDYVPN